MELNMSIDTDTAIIGGGASGYAAAIEHKRVYPEAQLVIAERLDKTGRKLLATGNGRCNLSNRNLTYSSYHGSVNAMKIIERTPGAEEFFESLGVLCTTDREGRIYPYSRNSSSILNALRLKASDLGVYEECGFNADKIEKDGKLYIIHSGSNIIRCKHIIVAAGGYAAPLFGTDGSIIRLFRNMGYKTAKISPAVAPVKVSSEKLKGLKGVRVKGKVSAVSEGKVLRSEEGEIQFTDNFLSGICIFNLAYLVPEYENKLSIKIDLMPEMTFEKLVGLLFSIQSQRYTYSIENFLSGIFVKNLAVYIMKHSLNRALNERILTLKYKEICAIASFIKSIKFDVIGLSPWQNAQVTSGGIHGSCVNEKLESKLHKGIYFSGEVLDCHGDCGGYNLQWAWSSGIWSGRHCANSLKNYKM